MFTGLKSSLVAHKGLTLLSIPVLLAATGGGAFAVLHVTSSATSVAAAAPSLGGGSVTTSATGNNGNGNGNGNGNTVTFSLSGAVVPAPGLILGKPASLPVTVTNPSSNKNKEVLTVTSITVTATAASPGCDTSNLTVGSYDASAPGATPYVLTNGTSKVIPIPILLVDKLNADQTPCRGKTFPLHVEGIAGVTK